MLKEQKLNLYFPSGKTSGQEALYSAAHFLPVLCLVHHTRAAWMLRWCRQDPVALH